MKTEKEAKKAGKKTPKVKIEEDFWNCNNRLAFAGEMDHMSRGADSIWQSGFATRKGSRKVQQVRQARGKIW